MNLYGPTETTVYATAYRIKSAPDQPMRIGRPLSNTKLYILDEQRQLAPLGDRLVNSISAAKALPAAMSESRSRAQGTFRPKSLQPRRASLQDRRPCALSA